MNQTQQNREAIEQRAYELFMQRGGEHGHDADDWYRAESELSPIGAASARANSDIETGTRPIPASDGRKAANPEPAKRSAPQKSRSSARR